MQPDSSHRCWGCDAALESDVIFCPHCGLQVRTTDPEPTEVRTYDVVLSVIMAVVALSVTLPLMIPLFERVLIARFRNDVIGSMILIGLWNGYVLGLPLLVVTRRWYLRVRQGQLNHAWVWHDYWYLQARVLWPVWCMLLYAIFVGIASLGR